MRCWLLLFFQSGGKWRSQIFTKIIKNKTYKMDLIKIIDRLEDKGIYMTHNFVENNESVLQALIDETEASLSS